MSNNAKSYIVVLFAALLALLLPMLSVANKLKELPSENISSEFEIRSEDEPYDSSSKVSSIVVGDFIYSFEAVSGKLYIKKIDANLELVDSVTLDFSSDVWNLTPATTGVGEVSLYYRTNKKLKKIVIDTNNLELLRPDEMLATDVNGFDAYENYVFYFNEDTYYLYDSGKLLDEGRVQDIKSAKIYLYLYLGV